jgi:hypothetical protein
MKEKHSRQGAGYSRGYCCHPVFTTEDCHRVQTPTTPGWRAGAGLELPSVVHKPAEKRHGGHGRHTCRYCAQGTAAMETHVDTVLARELKKASAGTLCAHELLARNGFKHTWILRIGTWPGAAQAPNGRSSHELWISCGRRTTGENQDRHRQILRG